MELPEYTYRSVPPYIATIVTSESQASEACATLRTAIMVAMGGRLGGDRTVVDGRGVRIFEVAPLRDPATIATLEVTDEVAGWPEVDPDSTHQWVALAEHLELATRAVYALHGVSTT